MKKLVLALSVGIIIFFSVHRVLATTSYTTSDVASHNTSSSCWVIYNGGVYDITTYLSIHNQRYQNITSWCGTDMTTDFDNVLKHQGTATTLLESFKIGILGTNTNTTTTDTTTTSTTSGSTTSSETTKIKNTNPYNWILPFIIGIILYWGTKYYFFSKNENKPKWATVKNFNGFWNTILLLFFLIPTFGFGIYMILQYTYTSLADADFNFLYWHVELSVFMGAIGISHFLQRFRTYLIEIKRQ